MNITSEQVEQIPEIYRDFMLILKSIPDSRQSVVPINGLLLGNIFTSLRPRHHYEPSQIRAIADNLKKAGFVEEDGNGFFKPTSRGETLIEAISETLEPVSETVPDFPNLPGL
jgi:hypothetical protein